MTTFGSPTWVQPYGLLNGTCGPEPYLPAGDRPDGVGVPDVINNSRSGKVVFLSIVALELALTLWISIKEGLGQAHGRSDGNHPANVQHAYPPPKNTMRAVHFDMLRVCFTVFMLMHHYGLEDNPTKMPIGTLLLQMVPLYFFGISGFCTALSRKPLLGYVGRLLVFFVIGCSFNVVGAFVENKDDFRDNWQTAIWNNSTSVFVMNFLLAITAAACFVQPMLICLQMWSVWREELVKLACSGGGDSSAGGGIVDLRNLNKLKLYIKRATAWYGTVCLLTGVVAMCFQHPLTSSAHGDEQGMVQADLATAPFWQMFCQLHVILLCAMLSLIIDMRGSTPRIPKTEEDAELADAMRSIHYKHYENKSALGWLFLLINFALRVCLPHALAGYTANFCMYAIGPFLFFRPLAGGPRVAGYLKDYAILLLCISILLPHLPALGRCDAYPYLLWYERLRFYTIDLMLQVMLFTGFWEMRTDRLKIAPCLNTWALVTFVTHIGWQRVCIGLGIENWAFPLIIGVGIPLVWFFSSKPRETLVPPSGMGPMMEIGQLDQALAGARPGS